MTIDNKFDDLLTDLGTGPWNILYFIGAAYWYMLVAPQAINGVYLAPAINYTCLPPEKNESIVTVSEDSCSYISVTQSGAVVEEACTEWDFDTSVFSSTLTSEFSLVCGRNYLRALYQSLYTVGSFFSPLVAGYIADRYGRKVVVVGQQIFIILCSVSITFFDNFIAILIVRFFLGLTYMLTFIIFALEVCEPKHRAIVGVLLGLPFGLGTMAWGGIAYFIRDWRWLQIGASLPNLLILPILYLMDESPRWLIVRGHHDQAMQVLRKAARWNRVSLQPEAELRALMKDIQRESVVWRATNTDKTNKRFRLTMPNLLRTRPIQIITVIVCIDYFTVSSVYYGLNLSGENYTSDPFLYVVLIGLVEDISYIFTAPVIDRWGRRIPIVLAFLFCGAVISVIAFIPPDLQALMMTLALVGKLCISGAFQTLYVYGAELFPTEVRLQGIGAAAGYSQAGAAVAPFVTTVLSSVVSWAPSLIFGMAAVAAGLLTLVLRETKGVALPDTLADLSSTTTTATSSTPMKDADNTTHEDQSTQN